MNIFSSGGTPDPPGAPSYNLEFDFMNEVGELQ
jgi:hypothetical protein